MRTDFFLFVKIRGISVIRVPKISLQRLTNSFQMKRAGGISNAPPGPLKGGVAGAQDGNNGSNEMCVGRISPSGD